MSRQGLHQNQRLAVVELAHGKTPYSSEAITARKMDQRGEFVTGFSHAASATLVIMIVSNSTGVKRGLDPISWTRCHLGYAASASVVETLAS